MFMWLTSDNQLVGVVSLFNLMVAESGTHISQIMGQDVISIPASADQEEVARLMSR